MTARIPLSEPYLNGREEELVISCIRDNWVSSVGPYVSEFETAFADYVGAKRAVACASGTAALHLMLRAHDIGQGDIVLVSTMTFIASVNAIRYVGAEPVLVDCCPRSWQFDPELLRRFLEDECCLSEGTCVHSASGKRVAAVLPVHILGHAVDMEKLMSVVAPYSFPVLEDAAEALGVTVAGRQAGCIGSAGCFSFNGNKTITTGSGGMVATDSDELADRIKFLSEQAKLSGPEYVHAEVGYNYRMTNLHAALGLAQLEQLDSHLARKSQIAERYNEAFEHTNGVSTLEPPEGSRSGWWLYTIAVDKAAFGLSARELMAKLADAAVDSRPLWQPAHLSPAHPGTKVLGGENAERLYASCLSLPSSVSLTEQQQQRVIEVVEQAGNGSPR